MSRSDSNPIARTRRIPGRITAAYTVYMIVLVPYYLHALGPVNFLYYCDFALLLTLPGLWMESRLLLSMVAVGVMFPQLIWSVDFFAEACGFRLLGVSAYMFRNDLPLAARLLSTFHLWQPILLVWLTRRLGYDRRAFAYWSGLVCSLLTVCFLWVPERFNINYVFGFGDSAPQTWMPAAPYFVLWTAAIVIVLIWPAHLLLRRLCVEESEASSVVA